MIAIIPVVVMLAGLLLYLMASNPKAQRIGEILFSVGAFFTVWVLSGQSVKLF